MSLEDVKRLVGRANSSVRTNNRDFIVKARNGLTRFNEDKAYSVVLPYLTDENDEEIALRVVGLITSTLVPQDDTISFGSWLSSNERLETKLLVLMRLSREQAIDQIFRIINLHKGDGKAKDGFNWNDLTEILYFWGAGVDDKSLKHRQRILKDFYRVKPEEKKKEIGNPELEAEEGNDEE